MWSGFVPRAIGHLFNKPCYFSNRHSARSTSCCARSRSRYVFVFCVCILCLYFVFCVCILYFVFVFCVCILCLYFVFVFCVCILCSYFEFCVFRSQKSLPFRPKIVYIVSQITITTTYRGKQDEQNLCAY